MIIGSSNKGSFPKLEVPYNKSIISTNQLYQHINQLKIAKNPSLFCFNTSEHIWIFTGDFWSAAALFHSRKVWGMPWPPQQRTWRKETWTAWPISFLHLALAAWIPKKSRKRGLSGWVSRIHMYIYICIYIYTHKTHIIYIYTLIICIYNYIYIYTLWYVYIYIHVCMKGHFFWGEFLFFLGKT